MEVEVYLDADVANVCRHNAQLYRSQQFYIHSEFWGVYFGDDGLRSPSRKLVK